MPNDKVNFDYGTDMSGFMADIQRTLVQQDDYRGMGGHGVVDSLVHGTHSQVSIGMGDKTINFRENE